MYQTKKTKQRQRKGMGQRVIIDGILCNICVQYKYQKEELNIILRQGSRADIYTK